MSFPRYPKYKDSGVEWLGEVPDHWQVAPLKAFASHNDEVIDETTDAGDEILYVDISSVDGVQGIRLKEAMRFGSAPSRARRRVKDGDIIVSTVRTYLRAIAQVHQPEKNLVVSTGFAVLRSRGEITADYLGYMLSTSYFLDQVVARSTGVSYPAINASDLVGIPIVVPPRGEQRRIAAFLHEEVRRIDLLIADHQQLIDLLQEKRQSAISRAVTRGPAANAPLKTSGINWLGDIPAHWEVAPLKNLVAVPITDGPHETPEFLDEGIPFVSAEAVSSGVIDFGKIRGFVAEADNARYSLKYSPRLHDIYMVKSGATTGVTAIVVDRTDFNIWSPLAAIRCGPRLAPYFLLNFMRSRHFLEAVSLGWSFGTQQNIGMGVIENLPCPVPPVEEQLSIIAHLDDEVAELENLRLAAGRSIALLEERRIALISAAITGKIDVRNYAAGQAEAA